ncbi:hypothetical protein VTN49DRAFT_1876 [Thermomyces lanuginosus]|uniref:uncharacterized protein n=1 Tax=Thermomyces lanuginosus TaxID=5541 RepID=UPI0037424AD5
MWINGDIEVFDILDAATDAELALVKPYLEMPRRKLFEAYRRINHNETKLYKFGRRVQTPQSRGFAFNVRDSEFMHGLDLMPSGLDYGSANRTLLREIF